MQNRYIFLPILLFIGIVTSYEDLKLGKIRNLWIIIGLVYAIIFYPIMSFFNALDFKMLLSNSLISIFVGYGLWKFNLWSAGDAKLFMVYSLLLPMEVYSRVYVKFFPALGLLINIFVPATIFLLIKAIINLIKNSNINDMKKKFFAYSDKNKFNLIRVVFGFTIIFLFIHMIRQKFTGLIVQLIPDRNFALLISFLVYRPLSNIFKKNKKLIWIAFLSVFVYITFGIFYSLGTVFDIAQALKMAVMVMLLFEIYRKIMDLYIEASRSKNLPFAIWMFLGILIVWFS